MAAAVLEEEEEVVEDCDVGGMSAELEDKPPRKDREGLTSFFEDPRFNPSADMPMMGRSTTGRPRLFDDAREEEP